MHLVGFSVLEPSERLFPVLSATVVSGWFSNTPWTS